MEIEPKIIIRSSESRHLKSVAATLGVTSEELFVMMSEIKTKSVINKTDVRKKQEYGNYSYMFEKGGKVLARLVCAF